MEIPSEMIAPRVNLVNKLRVDCSNAETSNPVLEAPEGQGSRKGRQFVFFGGQKAEPHTPPAPDAQLAKPAAGRFWIRRGRDLLSQEKASQETGHIVVVLVMICTVEFILDYDCHQGHYDG